MMVLAEAEQNVPVEVWKAPDVNERLCALMGKEIAMALLTAGALEFTRDSYGTGEMVTVQARVEAKVIGND